MNTHQHTTTDLSEERRERIMGQIEDAVEHIRYCMQTADEHEQCRTARVFGEDRTMWDHHTEHIELMTHLAGSWLRLAWVLGSRVGLSVVPAFKPHNTERGS